MLLPYSQQQIIKPVSKNNQTKFEQISIETQDLELDQLLGTVFYQEVVDNYVPTTTATTTPDIWQELVEGSVYTGSCGNQITQKGLWYVLAYLNYASYINEAHIADTLTGFVQKTRPDSQQINYPAQKNLMNKNREFAFNYFDKTRDFLCVNHTDYPNWNVTKEKKVRDFTLKGYKRTIR